jgi:hypothetical protein
MPSDQASRPRAAVGSADLGSPSAGPVRAGGPVGIGGRSSFGADVSYRREVSDAV